MQGISPLGRWTRLSWSPGGIPVRWISNVPSISGRRIGFNRLVDCWIHFLFREAGVVWSYDQGRLIRRMNKSWYVTGMEIVWNHSISSLQPLMSSKSFFDPPISNRKYQISKEKNARVNLLINYRSVLSSVLSGSPSTSSSISATNRSHVLIAPW